jgi:F0F1-type ATP synthase assembly protein I
MDRKDNPWALALRYASLAVMLPATTFAGYLIGYLLDRIFHTNFLYIAFLLLGIAAGFLEVFREVQKDTHDGGR